MLELGGVPLPVVLLASADSLTLRTPALSRCSANWAGIKVGAPRNLVKLVILSIIRDLDREVKLQA
jgi:hypothetical protein